MLVFGALLPGSYVALYCCACTVTCELIFQINTLPYKWRFGTTYTFMIDQTKNIIPRAV